MTKPQQVVVDREFGEQLMELNQSDPVWIVDTPTNRGVAEEIWAARPNCSHLEGITTFKVGNACLLEDSLISEMDTIDLHHGIYSTDPPYTVLDVIGIAASEKVKARLSQFGFNEFQETPKGFRAVRPLRIKMDSR